MPRPAPPGPADTTNMVNEVMSNVPQVDTNIDPTGMMTQAVEADVTQMQPPTDIDAATIGDYQGYDAVTDTVQDDSTVESRLNNLLSQGSDFMDRAAFRGTQMANRRGMLNSSMAAGAAQASAIDAALPIAQQDASTFFKQQQENQRYQNEAGRFASEQAQRKAELEAGMEQDARMKNAEMDFEANKFNADALNKAASDFAAEQNKNNFAVLDKQLTAALNGIDNNLAMGLESMKSQFRIMENMDTISGSIYQQMVGEIGTILANTKDFDEAVGKINTLIDSAGSEFSFSNGAPMQSAGGGGGSGTGVSSVGGGSGGGGGGGGGSTRVTSKNLSQQKAGTYTLPSGKQVTKLPNGQYTDAMGRPLSKHGHSPQQIASMSWKEREKLYGEGNLWKLAKKMEKKKSTKNLAGPLRNQFQIATFTNSGRRND